MSVRAQRAAGEILLEIARDFAGLVAFGDDDTRRFAEIIDDAFGTAEPKRFPVLGTGGTVAWTIAERAYRGYSAKFGSDQSLERLAKRGGFAPDELEEYAPGWEALDARLKFLERQAVRYRKALHEVWRFAALGGGQPGDRTELGNLLDTLSAALSPEAEA